MNTFENEFRSTGRLAGRTSGDPEKSTLFHGYQSSAFDARCKLQGTMKNIIVIALPAFRAFDRSKIVQRGRLLVTIGLWIAVLQSREDLLLQLESQSSNAQ